MRKHLREFFRAFGQPTIIAPRVSASACEPTPVSSGSISPGSTTSRALRDVSEHVSPTAPRLTAAEFLAAERLEGDREEPIAKYRDEPMAQVPLAEHARQLADLLTMSVADSMRFRDHEIRNLPLESGGEPLPHIIVTDRQFRDGYAELCADNNWVPHKHDAVARATRRLLDIQKRYSPGYKCSETGRHLGRDIEYRIPCSEALKARKPRASVPAIKQTGTVVALTRKGGLVAQAA